MISQYRLFVLVLAVWYLMVNLLGMIWFIFDNSLLVNSTTFLNITCLLIYLLYLRLEKNQFDIVSRKNIVFVYCIIFLITEILYWFSLSTSIAEEVSDPVIIFKTLTTLLICIDVFTRV